jgi:hypothetical protein
MDKIVIHSVEYIVDVLKLLVTCRCGVYHPRGDRRGALEWSGFSRIWSCYLIFHCYGDCAYSRIVLARNPIDCLLCLNKTCNACLPVDEHGQFILLTYEGVTGKVERCL